MGQQGMGKPAKAKPSAEADETPDELDARLRELAQDCWAAFFRDQTEENLQRANLLSAIGYSPDRRKKLAQYERRFAGEEARTDPPHPDLFWRKVWCKLVPVVVAHRHGEPEAVARDLVVCMPVALRLECSKLPKERNRAWGRGCRRGQCSQLRARTRHVAGVRRLGLTQGRKGRAAGLGVTKDDAKSLLRKGQWEAWVREHGATKAAEK
jgi:hypothetical protein